MTIKEKRERRAKRWKLIGSYAAVYVSCIAGSLLRKALPDVGAGLVLVEWNAAIAGVIVGLLVAMVKDRMSNPEGRHKKVAIVRRVEQAFLWGYFAVDILRRFGQSI